MASDPLEAVRQAATEAETAIARRDAAVKAASDAGLSLRVVAAAARLSHSGVAKIVKR